MENNIENTDTTENTVNTENIEHTEKSKNKNFVIIGLVVAVLVIVGIFYAVSKKDGQTDQNVYNQEVSTADPVDIVLDFYNPWLDAVRSTSTDPYTVGFATEKLLSEELRARLLGTVGHAETEIDPVLCQTTTPTQITGRIVSQQENETRVLVMAKEKELTAQSVFTLKRHNDGWFIDSILCAPGEFEIPREFSFESEGFLLKNVPPPLNAEYWHIVFEQNGEQGHAVPLLFDAESSCISTDKTATVCVPEQFTEAVKIHVYGQALESGVTVKRLEFIQ